MLDIQLRPLKDRVFDPVAQIIPTSITPVQLTGLGFVFGVLGCIFAAKGSGFNALLCWLANRYLDCLDGAVARHRNQASDLGGFLDLLADFVVYSAIPIACGLSPAADQDSRIDLWLSIATVEATFHINNFVLLFVAVMVEKRNQIASLAGAGRKDRSIGTANHADQPRLKELTSISMRPALIEGTESGLIFTLMFAFPTWTSILCALMSVLVSIGICQRVFWLIQALR